MHNTPTAYSSSTVVIIPTCLALLCRWRDCCWDVTADGNSYWYVCGPSAKHTCLKDHGNTPQEVPTSVEFFRARNPINKGKCSPHRSPLISYRHLYLYVFLRKLFFSGYKVRWKMFTTHPSRRRLRRWYRLVNELARASGGIEPANVRHGHRRVGSECWLSVGLGLVLFVSYSVNHFLLENVACNPWKSQEKQER